MRLCFSESLELYCSAVRYGPGRERRNYWATEDQYQYNEGSRRDMVHVVWGEGGDRKYGCAQLTGFITMAWLGGPIRKGVIIRWLDKSSLSTHTDHRDRSLCDYPLSFNHCLW